MDRITKLEKERKSIAFMTMLNKDMVQNQVDRGTYFLRKWRKKHNKRGMKNDGCQWNGCIIFEHENWN